ncbi:MAG: outer membrane beta-barrel protein [Bacteroidetes bacterium]|nr:outer membrane beta-barrel protein [Bacteroidota bacterium]MCL2303692.1 outer membrane beta-barrel protein [Lentimicrobiaceae bacterium]
MKKIKKTANAAMKFFIILFVFTNLNVLAQKNTSLEFSAHLGGGFDAFLFKPSSKDISSAGYGGEIGGGFAGFFSPQVGIYIGAGFNMANIKSKVTGLKHVTNELIDPDHPYTYNLHTTLNGYSELQKMMFINIPVMFQFQTKHKQYWNWKQNKNVGFYLMGGVKLFLLVSNKYDVSVASLYNAAYYPELDNWADTQTFKGFGLFDGNSTSGKLDFGLMATLALETGVKWRIDKNVFLYTGVYFDYGLNDPFKDSREPHSNFISQKHLENLTLLKFADKVNLMAVGIKVRFAFLRTL